MSRRRADEWVHMVWDVAPRAGPVVGSLSAKNPRVVGREAAANAKGIRWC